MTLLQQHEELLKLSAISDEVAQARGYFSVEQKRDLEKIGFGRSQQITPTLSIPIFGVVAGEDPWYIHRPDRSRVVEGRTRKYEIPAGRKISLDVHPHVRPNLANRRVPLFISEGSRKVDALITAGAEAVIGVVGVWSWRGRNDYDGLAMLPDWEWVSLKEGRQVYVVYDSDILLKEPVALAMNRMGAALKRMGAHVAYTRLPSGPGGVKMGADDYLAAGHVLDDIVRLSSPHPPEMSASADIGGLGSSTEGSGAPPEPMSLKNAVAVYQRWLHLPDPEPLFVLWGAIAANRLQSEPVWLLLVDVSGGGKTEAIRACGDLPECPHISALTEAGLLSGTPSHDRAHDATGGVLRQIGNRGVIVAKDFTSVLAMERNQRGVVLAALREVYDGDWTRALGTDGGRFLRWRGKAGLIGGVTPEIDRQYLVLARLGQRFLLHRPAKRDPKAERRAILKARRNVERLGEMRRDLRDAALGVFAAIPDGARPRRMSDAEGDWLDHLVMLVARGRAGVLTAYNGEIVDKIPPELPTRLVMSLAGLLAGMDLVGVERAAALQAVRNTALGCSPQTPREVLDHLLGHEARRSTKEVAVATRQSTKSARRVLEELLLHDLVDRTSKGEGHVDEWSLTSWARERLNDAYAAVDVGLDHYIGIFDGESESSSEPSVGNPNDHASTDDDDDRGADEGDDLVPSTAAEAMRRHGISVGAETAGTEPETGDEDDHHEDDDLLSLARACEDDQPSADGSPTSNGLFRPPCCCVDGGEGPAEDGRCSRCWGWPR